MRDIFLMQLSNDGMNHQHDQSPLISVEHFHKCYDQTVAVEDLSFRVEAGTVLGLVGPNGAGKTTTLRTLTGIIPPTRGRLCIGGHDIVTAPVAAKRSFAYVPDDPKLFDGLTVWEHLQFTAAAYQVENFERQARELLERFELVEKSNTDSRELSRGMRQKVALCCALLHSPPVLLLDEPLTGLDPRGIRTLKDTIRTVAKTGGAVVLSSHLLALVEDICEQYLILHHGRKLFSGTLPEAKSAFCDVQVDTSLEEVFFRATENTSPTKP